jgi:hypothetical protein
LWVVLTSRRQKRRAGLSRERRWLVMGSEFGADREGERANVWAIEAMLCIKPMGWKNFFLTACSLPRQRTRRTRPADWYSRTQHLYQVMPIKLSAWEGSLSGQPC